MWRHTRLGSEILEQPDALERFLEEERENVDHVARRIRERAPRYVVLAARGSSDNAARYAQYVLGAVNALPAALATPSLFSVYGRPPRLRDALVVAISQSGRSPDIVAVVEEARRQGAVTVAITNDSSSPVASAAENVIELRSGLERSVAATKTYTGSLMATALLSASLAGDEERLHELREIPSAVELALRDTAPITEAAAALARAESLVVLSRGYNHATAFEIALKLKELAYVVAEPYSSADFQHGPVAMVERGFPVLAVIPEGAVAEELVALARNLRARGADIVALTPLKAGEDVAGRFLPLPGNVPEWLSPIVTVVPGQILAVELARVKGIDPERPRGLAKVTVTR